MVFDARAVGGHDHFQHGAVVELVRHLVHGNDVAVKFLGQYGGIGDDVEILDLRLHEGGVVTEGFKGLGRNTVLRFANAAGNESQSGVTGTKSVVHGRLLSVSGPIPRIPREMRGCRVTPAMDLLNHSFV